MDRASVTAAGTALLTAVATSAFMVLLRFSSDTFSVMLLTFSWITSTLVFRSMTSLII